MNIRTHLPVLCLLALASLAPSVVSAAEDASTDRIIVKWRGAEAQSNAGSAREVQSLATRIGRPLQTGRAIGGRMSVVRLPSSQRGSELAATLAALRADPDVELAEPDRRVKIQAVTPSDPLFASSQWYLRSTEIAAIRADAAWDTGRGGASVDTSTVVIAVLDTGIRPDHPDLAAKLLPGYDFVSVAAVANDGDGWDADPSDPGDFLTAEELASDTFKNGNCGSPSSSTWHGTRVSGLIGASTDNATGIAGVGFNVRILPVRVLGKCGGFESDVIAGMYWAAGLSPPPPLLQSTSLPVNPHPAQILNLSLGSDGACRDTYAAAVRDMTAHGVLVVASAGNDGTAVGTPASCTGALAVAGLRQAGTKVGYSDLGPEVGIAAPAGNCVNTGPTDPCLFALTTTTNLGTQQPGANGYTDTLLQATYGTSFSAPLAAGTAGLMKAVNPALTPALLILRIKQSARAFPTTSTTVPAPPNCQLPTVATVQATECICNTSVCGAGMLNAEGAVTAALRPAVLAKVDGVVGIGRALTLDGTQSAASTGRAIASWSWTVESATGGASTPVIQSANQAQATVQSPAAGIYVLRLTVTDNLGSSDFATVTVTAADGATSSAPPPQSSTSGGGGDMTILSLALLALLLLTRRPRARQIARL